MYHTWFFQKRLAQDLSNELIGLSLVECFSQQKDELILSFADRTKELHLKADLGAQAGFLSFQRNFARARRNSVDLFSSLIDKEVKSIDSFLHERSFYAGFDSGECLIFKMHGTRSNIVRSENDRVVEIFRSDLKKDWDIIPSTFGNNEELSDDLLKKLLGRKNLELITDDGSIDMLSEQLLGKGPIYLTTGSHRVVFSLLPIPNHQFVFSNAVDASNKFAELHYRYNQLEKEKASLISQLQKRIKQASNYIEKTSIKRESVLSARNAEEIGHLIMANLHQIESGSSEINVDDLYSEGKVSIKLNPRISPQKNAENYYRKSKNRKIELENLEENLNKKKQQIVDLNAEIDRIKQLENIREVRAIQTKSTEHSRGSDELIRPYHEFRFEGWEIMVGKNAKSNDELTQRVAKKNDLWLHARDVSGSHVVIKERPGTNYPNHLIEKAASLAAYYSKRKTDSLCPVIYTPKKFVRKLKGTPAGQVVVDREQVVLVEPSATL